jgi:hypothetical protein
VARAWRLPPLFAALAALAAWALPAPALAQPASHNAAAAPTPIEQAVPADWIFVFKFNASSFPTAANDPHRACPFGGTPANNGAFSQAYAAATSQHPKLDNGPGLAGAGLDDPLGATFAKIWSGNYFYVVWNDQFYAHPPIRGCSQSCSAPWGHSKGVLAWTETGEGLLIQVTTPSWPAAAAKAHPRPGDGNTLGCIQQPNNLKFSQHFLALRLSADDVGKVLDGLANASVVTDPANPVLVRSGGPAALQAKVARLGVKSASTTVLDVMLSTGVRLISKPSALNVPPWQLVSSRLGGVPLRAATWWANPAIPSTGPTTPIGCWAAALPPPGAVAIATSGHWAGKTIDLRGGSGNHGKVGVSTGGAHPYAIFGDMNQQGRLSGDAKACKSSQNGRGGMFFVVENQDLHDSLAALIAGGTAPIAP